MSDALSVKALIATKRGGGELERRDLADLLRRYMAGEMPDYQMSALLMAIYFRGMTASELDQWTESLIGSGERWSWSHLAGPIVDKHSTGGVGDKVSLLLAPLLAALGLKVPMVSGRALGHTGGTLDKLESIPGLRTALSRNDFERLLTRVGFAMGGQTPTFVPLDGALYALRDVTATVESVPLIAASIMSKKVAEGVQHLVLDVKVGAGAFLPDSASAEELARVMIALGRRHGVHAEALLTSMEQPLGRTAGNALEIQETIATLLGKGPADLVEVTLALAARLLVMTGACRDESVAVERARAALADGSALEVFRRWIPEQDGDPRVIDDLGLLPGAPVRVEVRASRGGYVQSLDARKVGELVVRLGGGRQRKGDKIDPAVGFVFDRKVGDEVAAGDRLATVHASKSADAELAVRELSQAYVIDDDLPPGKPLILKHIPG
jgi:pyrimidine-nucleoside phosphorylase